MNNFKLKHSSHSSIRCQQRGIREEVINFIVKYGQSRNSHQDKKYFITLNQWFNKSLIQEENLQPIYYPSINKKNWENYKDRFYKKFNKYPNHLSLLSYDLIGLIYYLSLKNDFDTTDARKLFKKENSFKGKIGIFDIKDNEINHRLNFYKVENKKVIEIF